MNVATTASDAERLFRFGLEARAADRAGQEVKASPQDNVANDWSPDGRFLINTVLDDAAPR